MGRWSCLLIVRGQIVTGLIRGVLGVALLAYPVHGDGDEQPEKPGQQGWRQDEPSDSEEQGERGSGGDAEDLA